ncbi:MAG: glycosyltransferase family 9 protein [Verrucomicrobiae bacterium]|nr:glycosyltransferase family 9 protein [Verrucomicrobiae bacterium]
MWNQIVFNLYQWTFRALAAVWPPDPKPLPPRPSRILVFSTAGIGDSLTDSVAIRALKETWPAARVTVVTHARRRAVHDHNPHIDEIIAHRKSPVCFLQNARKLRALKPDLVVVLRANDPDVWPLAYLANRRVVVSYEGMTRFGFLISHPVHFAENWPAGTPKPGPVPSWEIHGVEQTLWIVRQAGAKAEDKGLVYRVSEAEKKSVADRFGGWLGQKPLVVFQAGGGKRAAWRDWPVAHYAEVIRWVGESGLFEIAITGGTDNLARARDMEKQAGVPVRNLCALMSLSETAALLTFASALVSTDTGVMHLGFAVGTDTVALIHHNNPAFRVGPHGYGDKHAVLELERPAGIAPGVKAPMEGITPAAVIEKLKVILARKRTHDGLNVEF